MKLVVWKNHLNFRHNFGPFEKKRRLCNFTIDDFSKKKQIYESFFLLFFWQNQVVATYMVFYKIKEVAQNFIYFWIFFITFFGFPDFKPQNLNQRILFHRNLSNDPERKRNAFAGKYSKIRNIRKNVKFHRIFIELYFS